jgi:hypothetical protein
MIGALMLLLAQAATVDELAQHPALLEYYVCAAGNADRLARPAGDDEAPSVRRIAEESLDECRQLRAAALAVAVPAALSDPGIQQYLRTRNLTREQGAALAEHEFDRSIRRQLMINVAEARGEEFREQDVGE